MSAEWIAVPDGTPCVRCGHRMHYAVLADDGPLCACCVPEEVPE